jgi:hypothetical protein
LTRDNVSPRKSWTVCVTPILTWMFNASRDPSQVASQYEPGGQVRGQP